jgi:hypothetical protein
MIVVMSLPIVMGLLALFIYASYSEGKQMINGQELYSNQEPKQK